MKINPKLCKERSTLFFILAGMGLIASFFILSYEGFSKIWSISLGFGYFCTVLAFYTLKIPEIWKIVKEKKKENLIKIYVKIIYILFVILFLLGWFFNFREEPYFQIFVLSGIFLFSLTYISRWFIIMKIIK